MKLLLATALGAALIVSILIGGAVGIVVVSALGERYGVEHEDQIFGCIVAGIALFVMALLFVTWFEWRYS